MISNKQLSIQPSATVTYEEIQELQMLQSVVKQKSVSAPNGYYYSLITLNMVTIHLCKNQSAHSLTINSLQINCIEIMNLFICDKIMNMYPH